MPADAWAPYLVAQERYEKILADAFRRHGPRLVDLGYANAYDGPDDVVLDAMRDAIDDDTDLSFQYTPYGGRTPTRRRIAQSLKRRFGLPFHYRDVVLTPGAMAGLNAALRTLCGAGDEVLVLAPCWLDYPLYLAQLSIPFRFVPLTDEKRFDFEAIAAAVGPNTRAILFSHPGCPTGVVMPPADLERLAGVLAEAEQRHGGPIFVISDEAHRDVVFGGPPLRTPLEFWPRSVSVYSFGKSLFLQGQRIGYVAVAPDMPERDAVRERLTQVLRAMGLCTPTALMQRAVVPLLDYVPRLELVAERHAMVRGELLDAGYDVCPAEATFFVYSRCPNGDDFAFVEAMAALGVLVLPSSIFHEPGWFRISLTAKTSSIEAGLPAFRTVLETQRA